MKGSIKIAHIVLNAFDLILEDSEENELEIYDKKNNIVGKLDVETFKIKMNANFNNNVLSATLTTFRLPTTIVEGPGVLRRRPPTTDYCFSFNLTKSDQANISGRFNIITYGNPANLRCACTLQLHYVDSNGKKIQITSDGSVPLQVNCKDNDSNEVLRIAVGNYTEKGIFHRVDTGKYPKGHNYRSCKALELTENTKDIKIKLLNKERKEEDGNVASYTYIKELKEAKKYEKSYIAKDEELIQKGELAHEYDPTISTCLKKLSELLQIGDVSLFNNIISMCFDIYSDKVFETLTGFEREKFYHDNSQSLVEAYFGVPKDENGKAMYK